MDIKLLLYILSLAFQVAGAVLLIIKYCGKTKQRIINEYFPGSNIIERDDDDTVHLEKEKVQECVKRIYDNRISFAYIAIGYVSSVFGESSNSSKIEIMFYMIFSTIALILVEKIISSIFAKLLYHSDMEMKYSEIEDIADTVATNKEINEIIDGSFRENEK
ncbi:MAG: hypothetical protein HDR07_04155 [Lachnospiraceae bacterium]|nr:hypothetical protein [Lachnospiraceae bacterium]